MSRWGDLRKYSSMMPYYKTIRGDGLFFPCREERFRPYKKMRVYKYRTITFKDHPPIVVRQERHQFGIKKGYRRYRYRRWGAYHPGKYDRMTDIKFYGELPVKAFTSQNILDHINKMS